jgi:CheY-like chemotaxis protein
MKARRKVAPPLRILCAEDDEELLACTAELLHEQGHAVDCATDGEQALQVLLRDCDAFDLLITDRQMPHLDGVALVEESRRAGYRGKIIVFATALSELDRERFGNLAVNAIVEKASREQSLLEVVQRVAAAAR